MARRSRKEDFAFIIILVSALLSGSIALITKAVEGCSKTVLLALAGGFFLVSLALLYWGERHG